MMNRTFRLTTALSLLVLMWLPQLTGGQDLKAQEKRFKFEIDPKTPVKDLLPVPPKELSKAVPFLADDLAKVPEVQFQEPLQNQTRGPDERNDDVPKEERIVRDNIAKEKEKLLKQTAHLVAKINFLNRDHPDRFLKILAKDRVDLAGLPFVMGDACRLDKESSRLLRIASADARRFKAIEFLNFSTENPMKNRARIAALMQIVPSDDLPNRLGLVDYLGELKDTEATLALTRLALYSAENEVRAASLKALEKYTANDTKTLLLQGLNYPWPAVAENASQAIIHLKRVDLIPNLVSFLDQQDPRLPVIKEIQGQAKPVVRELIRINHHRNCLLCHAPGNTPDVTREVVTAAIPIPDEPLPGPSTYYVPTTPDILVRADVTYLRQDFSCLQEVPDADPWPKMQRFDFLVRTRILSEAEAKAYQAEFAKQKTSPYRQAALTALRALTGRDAEPTAAAWRKVLVMDLQRVD